MCIILWRLSIFKFRTNAMFFYLFHTTASDYICIFVVQMLLKGMKVRPPVARGLIGGGPALCDVKYMSCTSQRHVVVVIHSIKLSYKTWIHKLAFTFSRNRRGGYIWPLSLSLSVINDSTLHLNDEVLLLFLIAYIYRGSRICLCCFKETQRGNYQGYRR